MSTSTAQQPSPQLFFQTVNAHQKAEALKTALELEVFSAIAEGNTTAAQIAQRTGASEKGIRVLCDFLTIHGMLTKQGDQYGLTLDSATFLDKHSPAYLGDAVEFLCAPPLVEATKRLTEAVRKGGTAMDDEGTVSDENPVWVKFARGMGGLMSLPAQLIPKLVDPNADRKLRILDIAAGHGLFGIGFAKNNPQAEITAVDWKPVLEVAKENAEKGGVADRYNTIAGSAFDVDFGSGYDLVLLTNFLHHFDPPTNETLLRKVHDALADGGRAVTLEFVPNEDRVSPPDAASFSMQMLIGTPSGDAYTFSELERMFTNAGFSRSTIHPLPPTFQQVVISEK
ncbi:MAG TPA: class I SAM-dependent methyltransferase [Pyrinomonadaceae bacterium]|jgi:SAM-dependent methyltransferase|nr:class I SAM-dependent methyltransferase [Pyrinomonadaceae bacterium]